MASKDDLPFLPTATAFRAAASNAPLLIDDEADTWLTAGELAARVTQIAGLLGGTPKKVVLCCLPRTIDGVTAYLAAAEAGHGIILSEPDAPQNNELVQRYTPEWIWALSSSLFDGYEKTTTLPSGLTLWRHRNPCGQPVHPDFYLMLLTSGSTGSAKGVRLSYGNLTHNTLAIIQSLKLSGCETACTPMPLSYSFGLSILHMQLASGGRTVLTHHSMMSAAFWKAFRSSEANLFAGVPYHYEMLVKLNLRRLNVPTLTTFLQAGGKMALPLTETVWREIQERQGKMFVMYGQTEASPRIACLPLHEKPEKIGTTGVVLSGGTLAIDDGEIIYRGPNVMMGEASKRDDLARGDESNGVLRTGDRGTLDADGFLTITGRKQRMAKLFGQRIALDDLERLASAYAPVVAVECSDKAVLVTTCCDETILTAIRQCIVAQTQLPATWIEIQTVSELPTKASGKIDYQKITSMVA